MAHVKKCTASLLFALIMMGGCGEGRDSSLITKTPALSIQLATLDKADRVEAYITDGDTIKLTFDGTLTTIRLIGIDCFESRKNNKAYRQAYEHSISIEEVVSRGKRAKSYISAKLSKRANFYMEYDEDLFDRYDRTLGYVWFSEHEMLNLDIICEGYALPLTIKPNDKYAEKFTQCYEEAKAKGLGVWK